METTISWSESVAGRIRRRRISLEASVRGEYEKIGAESISVDVVATAPETYTEMLQVLGT